MTDQPEDKTSEISGEIPGETPIQRALRLKNAALAAKPKPPRGGRFQREQAAAASSNSKNKPWMTR
jgi:hypothetical protein